MKKRKAKMFYVVGRYMLLVTKKEKKAIIEALMAVHCSELAGRLSKTRKV